MMRSVVYDGSLRRCAMNVLVRTTKITAECSFFLSDGGSRSAHRPRMCIDNKQFLIGLGRPSQQSLSARFTGPTAKRSFDRRSIYYRYRRVISWSKTSDVVGIFRRSVTRNKRVGDRLAFAVDAPVAIRTSNLTCVGLNTLARTPRNRSCFISALADSSWQVRSINYTSVQQK